jgi:hypothetical protein
MGTIYLTVLILGLLSLIGFAIYSIFNKKGLTVFLYRVFTIGFWLSISLFIYQISMEVLTENGTVKISQNKSLSYSNHHSKGYAVPVNIMLYFTQKKTYKSNKLDAITGRKSNLIISRYLDERHNFNEEVLLKYRGITKKQLDSIFKFSPDVKITGNKLQIDYHSNDFLSTDSSSFLTKGYLNIKSTNWLFTFFLAAKNYLNLLLIILIFYQLKSLFKLLKKEITFSVILTKRLQYIGTLIILSQVLLLIFSIIFNCYYDYVGFENAGSTNGIQLNITPRLEFDITLILVGLGIFTLNILLKKGNNIQEENDLTI